jgi:hypothetical protein
MGAIDSCLNYLTNVDYSDSRHLRDAVHDFLSNALECTEVELWSRVMDYDDFDLYTDVLHSKNGAPFLPKFSCVLSPPQLEERLKNFEQVVIEIPLTSNAGLLPTPIHWFAFKRADALMAEERIIVERVLRKISRDCYRASIRRLYENLNALLPVSKDLTSFFHRAIHNVLLPEFSFEAASAFYYERKTESLILAATTGIRRKEEFDLKRSDIRYFTDAKSYTSKSFKTATEIVENVYKGRPLARNSQGETISDIQSRIYVPLRRWDGLGDSTHTTPFGVLRCLNANSDNNYHPITILEMAKLRIFSNAAAGLADRYLRALSILHDQERSTHGYNTDLCAIKYAAENIEKWIQRLSDANPNETAHAGALDEILFRTRDIIAVQDNMASQLMTVMHHAGSSRLVGRPTDESVCALPFTQVFMRLLAAKKGMSDCYSRSELRITFNGKLKADDDFIRIPALSISVGSMYLATRNIAENAIKYSRKSIPPKLNISWEMNMGRCEFYFRDYGIGISSKDEGFICREGFRSRAAQEMQLRGNGLGLAVSRSVLEAFGGSLTYMTPIDGEGGSTFKVSVPLR